VESRFRGNDRGLQGSCVANDPGTRRSVSSLLARERAMMLSVLAPQLTPHPSGDGRRKRRRRTPSPRGRGLLIYLLRMTRPACAPCLRNCNLRIYVRFNREGWRRG